MPYSLHSWNGTADKLTICCKTQQILQPNWPFPVFWAQRRKIWMFSQALPRNWPEPRHQDLSRVRSNKKQIKGLGKVSSSLFGFDGLKYIKSKLWCSVWVSCLHNTGNLETQTKPYRFDVQRESIRVCDGNVPENRELSWPTYMTVITMIYGSRTFSGFHFYSDQGPVQSRKLPKLKILDLRENDSVDSCSRFHKYWKALPWNRSGVYKKGVWHKRSTNRWLQLVYSLSAIKLSLWSQLNSPSEANLTHTTRDILYSLWDSILFPKLRVSVTPRPHRAHCSTAQHEKWKIMPRPHRAHKQHAAHIT